MGSELLTEVHAETLKSLFLVWRRNGIVSHAKSETRRFNQDAEKTLGSVMVFCSVPDFYHHLFPGDTMKLWEVSDMGNNMLKMEPEANNAFIHLNSLARQCTQSS